MRDGCHSEKRRQQMLGGKSIGIRMRCNFYTHGTCTDDKCASICIFKCIWSHFYFRFKCVCNMCASVFSIIKYSVLSNLLLFFSTFLPLTCLLVSFLTWRGHDGGQEPVFPLNIVYIQVLHICLWVPSHFCRLFSSKPVSGHYCTL